MCARLKVKGVPVYGNIDTGGDTTIINGTLFKKVVTVARFKTRTWNLKLELKSGGQKQQLRQQSSRVPQVVVRVQSQFYQVRGHPNHVHKQPLKICAGDELAIAKSAAVHLFNCPSTTFMLCKGSDVGFNLIR